MPPISSKLINSSISLLVIRLFQRSMGVVSMLILARILVPEDFGVIAVTSIVLLLADALASVGNHQYIIQKQHVETHDLNTAWTLDIALKGTLWLLIELAAPLFSQYFEDPRLTDTIRVAAFALLIGSLSNPGVILFKRNLEYNKLIKLSVFSKLIGFVVTVGMAITLRSYWAMIAGNLAISISNAVGSYVIHNFRPSLSFSRFQEQWSFSRWMLLESILGYSRTQIDKVLVAKIFGITDVGVYHVTKQITEMPGTDVISPALEPLLSAFSKDKYDREALSLKVKTTFFVIMCLVIPGAFYINSFSTPLVNLLLGDKWRGANELMSAFSFLLVAYAAGSICNSFLVSQAKVRQVFIYNLISVVAIVSALVLIPLTSIVEFAIYRTALELAMVTLLMAYTGIVISVSIFRFLVLCLPAIGCSLVSLYVYDYFATAEFSYSIIEVFVSVLGYFSVYLMLIILTIFALSKYMNEIDNAVIIIRQYLIKNR